MNKFSYSIGFIQLTIGLILFCYVIQVVAEFQAVRDKMQYAVADTEIYMLRDISSDQKFDLLVNEKEMLPKMVELYQYVDTLKNTEAYTADQSMELYFSHDSHIPEELLKLIGSRDKEAPMVSVTKRFFDVYQIEGDYGTDVPDSFFQEQTDGVIPVILGDNYKKYFHTGDTFTDIKKRTYRVWGFLKTNSYYVAPLEGKELIDLKNYIVRLDCIDTTDSVSLIQYFESVYFMTNDKAELNQLIRKSNELGLFDFALVNFSYQFKIIVADYIDKIFVNTIFLVMVVIFASLGMVGNLLQYISDHKKEFAIHIMCGADRKRVAAGILAKLLLMAGMGDIVVLILFGTSKGFFITLAFSICLILLILIYPLYIISRMTIQTMLRRSYE